jgi:hypothetical protein
MPGAGVRHSLAVRSVMRRGQPKVLHAVRSAFHDVPAAEREWIVPEGIPAVLGFKLIEGEMTGFDLNAAEQDFFNARLWLDGLNPLLVSLPLARWRLDFPTCSAVSCHSAS